MKFFPLLIGFALASFLVGAEETNSFTVKIRVDAQKREGELKAVWRFFGADEPNYAYMKMGRSSWEGLGRCDQIMFISAHTIY